MFVFRRPVRFAEVDAAGIVFFPRYHEYCHDALEAFFGELPGGYAALFRERDLGVPPCISRPTSRARCATATSRASRWRSNASAARA